MTILKGLQMHDAAALGPKFAVFIIHIDVLLLLVCMLDAETGPISTEVASDSNDTLIIGMSFEHQTACWVL